MARVLSALVLLPVVIGAVWFLPPLATLVLALVAAALAFVEYAAHRRGARRACSPRGPGRGGAGRVRGGRRRVRAR